MRIALGAAVGSGAGRGGGGNRGTSNLGATAGA